MNDTHQELRDLISDVVTGDGAQIDNLDMSDEEWDLIVEGMIKDRIGDRDNFPITLTFDNWMAMVKVARNNR